MLKWVCPKKYVWPLNSDGVGLGAFFILSRQTTCQHYKTSYCLVSSNMAALENHRLSFWEIMSFKLVHFFEPAMLAMLVYHFTTLVHGSIFGPSLPTSTPKLWVAALALKMSRCKRCNGNSDSWWKVCCHAPAVAVALRTMLKNLKFLAKKTWMEKRSGNHPYSKQKMPWKHSVWVYICVLLLPENMVHFKGPKWPKWGKRTIQKTALDFFYGKRCALCGEKYHTSNSHDL